MPHRREPAFADRIDAGRVLAQELAGYADRDDVIVLGLPRGGVIVAAEVAAALDAPLDILLVRKLGLPGNEEFALGAVASGGVVTWNEAVVGRLSLDADAVRAVVVRELAELSRREGTYRRGPPLDLVGKTVLVVDDGIATGSTMRAAATSVRRSRPAYIVVAAPVGAPDVCARLRDVADECVIPLQPGHFRAVGSWFREFQPTTDREVVECLERNRPQHGS